LIKVGFIAIAWTQIEVSEHFGDSVGRVGILLWYYFYFCEDGGRCSLKSIGDDILSKINLKKTEQWKVKLSILHVNKYFFKWRTNLKKENNMLLKNMTINELTTDIKIWWLRTESWKT